MKMPKDFLKNIDAIENDLIAYCNYECQTKLCEDCPLNSALGKLRRMQSIKLGLPYNEEITQEQTSGMNSHGRHFMVVKGGKK